MKFLGNKVIDMDFETFQLNCKYAKHGIKDGYSSVFELTCRRPDCIPKGHSWGICDRMHCPYFGIKIDDGVMIDAETGKTLLSFSGGRFIFGE